MLFSNGDKYMSVKFWQVSDAFGAIVEPLIPKPERAQEKQYKRKIGAAGNRLKLVKSLRLLSMCSERAFSGKCCPKNSSVARVRFTSIFASGNARAFSLIYGNAAYRNMTTRISSYRNIVEARL